MTEASGKRGGCVVSDACVHRYLVVSAGLVASINLGSVFSFGVLYDEMRMNFEESRAKTAAVQSLFLGVFFCSGFLIGIVVHRTGPRVGGVVGGVLQGLGLIISYFATSLSLLQIGYGVISGIGAHFVYLSSNVVVPLYFEGRGKVFALSVLAAGPGLGGIFFPYLIDHLYKTYGLHGTFLLLGGVSLHSVPCALFWSAPQQKPILTEEHTSSSGDGREGRSEVLFIVRMLGRNVQYVLFCIGLGLVISSLTSYETLFADIWLSKGLTNDNTVVLFMTFNLVSILGRVAAGLLKQIPSNSVLTTPIAAAFIGALASLVLNFTRGLAGNLAVCSVLGLVHGAVVSSMVIVLTNVVTGNQFSIGAGILFGFSGVLSAVSAPLYGYLREITGAYTAPILLIACCLLVGSILFLTAFIVRVRRKHTDQEPSVDIVTRL